MGKLRHQEAQWPRGCTWWPLSVNPGLPDPSWPLSHEEMEQMSVNSEEQMSVNREGHTQDSEGGTPSCQRLLGRGEAAAG